MDTKYELTRRQARQAAAIYLYQYLIIKANDDNNKRSFDLAKFIQDNTMNMNEILEKSFRTRKPVYLLENDLFTEIVKQLNDIDNDIKVIDQNLSDEWVFDRLSYMEQAILLVAYTEFKLGKVEHKIIINEAIEIAKIYCDDDSYKFINKVLDSISGIKNN